MDSYNIYWTFIILVMIFLLFHQILNKKTESITKVQMESYNTFSFYFE